MLKKTAVFLVVIAVVFLSQITVFAADTTAKTESTTNDINSIYDTSALYDSLSDDVKQSLENIGINGIDSNELSQISFGEVVNEIVKLAGENSAGPLKAVISLTALLLICSLLSSYKNSLSSELSSSLGIAAVLCATCTAALPVIEVISDMSTVVKTASSFMLAFVPVMVMIISSTGHAVSGASYYAMMIGAGEGVGQLSSKVIVPFLNMFLGVSVTASVCSESKLTGITSIISKAVKWVLGFVMTVFTAVLSFKQMITTSVDDVSTRAVRFTLNSFIPIVGSALSDAYKTVQGSVNLLKSGLGIFVIVSIAFVFLPIILNSLLWIFTLSAGKLLAEILGINQVKDLLEGVGTVLSTLLAIVLCIMSVYIISTALVIGAFMVCCLISPITSAISSIDFDAEPVDYSEDQVSTSDEAYANVVIKQAQQNLEQSLTDLLAQNNIKISECKIVLAKSQSNSIIIGDISIYMSNEYKSRKDKIGSIVFESFGAYPRITFI